jgi:hypothetical protein
MVVAAAAIAILAPASAALAASGARAHPAAVTRNIGAVSPRVPTHCNPGHFCSYNNTNGTSPCFQQPTSLTYLNWAAGCADEDESLNNNIAQPGYPGLTRVYHNTYQAGAFMCMDAGDYIDDVSKGHNGAYKFDQVGSSVAGYGASIKHNIQSSEIDATAPNGCVTNE